MDALLRLAAPWLQPAFTLWGSPVTWVELVAFMLSIWMVICNMRVHPLGWPLAMLSSSLYALLFLQFRLYGEAGLQAVFIALAGWGWWQWRRGHDRAGGPLRVHRMTMHQRLTALTITAAAWPALAGLLMATTDSDVPWLDALPTVGSLTGQALLGRKLIENWPVWVLVNLFSIGLFALKGLWLTVLLYAVFAVMALLGWRAWAGLEGRVRA